MMHNKATKLLITTLTMVLPFLVLPEVQAQIGWKKMNIMLKRSITTKEIVLQGIRGTSKNDVFAVGRVENTDVETNNTGIILHYDGNPARNWEEILPNEKKPKNLNAICRGAKGDFFAVGDKGTVLRGKGKEWKKIIQPKSNENLQGVWVSPKNTIFAVGDKGILIRGVKGGKNWFGEKITDKKLNAIWGISEKKLLVVGNDGTILFSKNGGKSWETGNNPDPDNHNLNSVWGFSEQRLYAVGDGGTILFSKDEGLNWKQQNNPVTANHDLKSIWGVSPNAVFAAGTPGTVLRCEKNEWFPLKSTTVDLTSVILHAIWVSSNPNAFIIGPGGFTGIGQLPPGYYIEGFIRDACSQISPSQPDPAGINDARGCIVTPTACPDVITADGNGRYEATSITGGGSPKIRFYHSNGKYKKEEPILSLYHNHSISNTTFLIPDPGVSNPLDGADCCISGVVSKRCLSWYCPVGNITVNLYELINCEYSLSQSIETNALGFYNFTGLGQGSYKIIPVAPEGCTFRPDTTNVFSIPISSPEAINFTDITLEGTGDCECPGNPQNPCNIP